MNKIKFVGCLVAVAAMTLQAREFRFIDLNKIFAESQEGRAIEAEAMKKQQTLAAELQKLQQEIMRKEASLKERAAKGLVKEDALVKQGRELESEKRKFELRAQEVEQELRDYQGEIQQKRLEPFRGRLRDTIKKFTDKNKEVVLMSTTGEVLYAPQELFVSDEILKSLNTEFAAKSAVPAAKVPSLAKSAAVGA